MVGAHRARPADPLAGAGVDGNLHEGGHAVVHFDDGDARFVVEDASPAPETLVVHWHHADGHSVVRASVFDLGEDHCRLTLVHDALSPHRPRGTPAAGTSTSTRSTALADREPDRTDWEPLAAHYREDWRADGADPIPPRTGRAPGTRPTRRAARRRSRPAWPRPGRRRASPG